MSDLPSKSAPLKSIFVISPIGKLDDTGFDFTKLFLEEIVKPAAADAGGFSVPTRADEVRAPGSITAKVVRDIMNADVCVADLTGRNANVMYEVAIAHAADKPVILLQQESGGPPFDFTDERVIAYSTRADQANRARRDLTEFLRNAHHEDLDAQLRQTMHPVRQVFRELQTRDGASEPQQMILDRLDSVSRRLQVMESTLRNASVVESEKAILRRQIPNGPLSIIEINEIVELASKYLDDDSVRWIDGHLKSNQPSVGTLKRLLRFLRALDGSSNDSALDEAALARARELVRDLPPF